MKKPLSLIAALMFPLIALGQTNVDRVASSLDSLATCQLSDWKMSPTLKNGEVSGDPTQKGFDDSQWQTLRIAQAAHLDSCWLRGRSSFPRSSSGRRSAGRFDFSFRRTNMDICGSMDHVRGISRGMVRLSCRTMQSRAKDFSLRSVR